MALVDVLHIPLELIRCHADRSSLVEHRLFAFDGESRFAEGSRIERLSPFSSTYFACLHLPEEFLPSRFMADDLFELSPDSFNEGLELFKDRMKLWRGFATFDPGSIAISDGFFELARLIKSGVPLIDIKLLLPTLFPCGPL